MSFQLRPYQTAIIDDVRARMQRGVKSILIQSPTGSGKTALTAQMLGTAAAKGVASIFTVHRRELVKQSTETFDAVKIRHGIIAPGFYEDSRAPVQIASVATLARRFQRLRRPKLIVWDECHHIAAKSWADIFRAIPEAFHIGLTATPERLDGKGLGDFFKEMVKGPSVAWLIEQGYLSPYRLFVPPGGVNVEGVHTKMGDFAKGELAAAADKPTITGDAIREYRKRADGKRAVVFCVSIEHSKHVVAQFQAAGISAAHVDGETDVQERDAAIRRFERGEIKVLSNVELFGEGFDLPAIEAVIGLRPTQSLALCLQQWGRGLRTSPGKERAILIDHAGNAVRHGLPDWDREWSLSGRDTARRPGDTSAAVKVCPRCFAAQFSGRPVCQFCGHIFDAKPRTIEHVEGELVEVDPATLQRQRAREQYGAETEEQLVALAKSRGYTKPYAWARHILMARQAKKLRQGRTA